MKFLTRIHCLCASLIVVIGINLVSALPNHQNLRIQVNNENSLQSAPYLLEAVKAEANATTAGQPMKSVEQVKPVEVVAVPEAGNRVEPATAKSQPGTEPQQPQQSPPQPLPSGSQEAELKPGNAEASQLSRESAMLDELINQDAEAQASSQMESVAVVGGEHQPADYVTNADSQNLSPQASSSESGLQSEGLIQNQQQPQQVNSRKPQLPVTNSHLKKPAYEAATADDELLAAGNLEGDKQPAASSGSGAKSLVSPSVAVEPEPAPPGPSKGVKKMPGVQPDTLDPAQIMQGVTNASQVPGIVNREYGHHTRTRITLGGGYVRDRLPPLVNPASSSYVDDKPEKPVAPLEKASGSSAPPTASSQRREQDEQEEPSAGQQIKKVSSADQQQQSVVRGRPDARCPKSGLMTIEHPTACDKYMLCDDGLISEHTCPNGLMYGTRDLVRDYCVHRWKADCGDKSVPNPISSPGCRWQYGMFSVQGSPRCVPDYYECYAGKFEVKKCAIDGQVYDDRTKSCQFAEQVGCANEALADFHCPPDDQANTYWPFPRYFLNERALIHCINDKPEIVRCTEGERVDPEHLHCIPIAKLNQQQLSGATNLETRKARERKKGNSNSQQQQLQH